MLHSTRLPCPASHGFARGNATFYSHVCEQDRRAALVHEENGCTSYTYCCMQATACKSVVQGRRKYHINIRSISVRVEAQATASLVEINATFYSQTRLEFLTNRSYTISGIINNNNFQNTLWNTVPRKPRLRNATFYSTTVPRKPRLRPWKCYILLDYRKPRLRPYGVKASKIVLQTHYKHTDG